MRSPSAEEHHERMKRGVDAVSKYLQSHFPDHVVEALGPNSRDSERGTRTFTIRNERDRHVLMVTDEVLDLDSTGARSHLERFRVAGALRETRSGEALVVTTNDKRIEPI